MRMNRCWCVTEHGKPLKLFEQPAPEPAGREVLVRITGAGVCHSDVHLWDGYYDLGGGNQLKLGDRGITLPMTMGHEIAGEIVAVGPQGDASRIGESVLMYPWLGCGECATCLRGDENLCTKGRSLGVFRPGGYATYAITPDAKYCIPLGTLDPAEAAPLACSGVTTYSALKKFGAAIADEPVVIVGAGGLGMMAMTILKCMGGKGSVVVDVDAAKREAALKAGALAAIDGRAPDAVQQLIAATGGGARCVLDLVGSPDTVNLAIGAAVRGTEIVIVGLYGGALTIPVPLFPLRPLTIRGSYVGNLAELEDLVRFAREGSLSLVPVNRRKQDEASSALVDLKAGKVIGRTVLVP